MEKEASGSRQAAAAAEIPLRCRCGHVQGMATGVSPSSGLRVFCYCRDCQAFARFLERPDVLDAAGGTDIFQMPTGRVKFTAGTDALRCVRLSDKGVLRWYTRCCNSPIGNTAGPRVPLIGIIHTFMDHEGDGRSRNEVLGPPLCRIFDWSARGPLPPTAPAPPTFRIFARRIATMINWLLRGLARPNPFFDERTGAPRSVPLALTRDERAALDE